MVEIVGLPGGYGARAKPDYTSLVAYQESRGLTRSQLTLDENNTKVVTLTSAAVATTTAVIDIKCPAGQEYTIMGVQNIPGGADARTAHALRMRLAGTADVEMSYGTKIRITKEKSFGDVIELGKIFYGDVSLTKNAGALSLTTSTLKTDLEWYRFKQNVWLKGEEHIVVYVLKDLASATPDIAIDSNHIKFALDVDWWS